MASSTSASSASASAAVDALLAPPTISAVILLDREGKRVAAKYYKDALPSAAAQLAFEKKIFARTSQRAPHDEPEVFLLDSFLVMYHGGFDRSSAPFSQLIVVAPATENELFVQLVLSAIEAPLTSLLAPEAGRSGLDALSVIYLTLDEVIDNGTILCSDPQQIETRVTVGEAALSAETSLSAALVGARDQIVKTLQS